MWYEEEPELERIWHDNVMSAFEKRFNEYQERINLAKYWENIIIKEFGEKPKSIYIGEKNNGIILKCRKTIK